MILPHIKGEYLDIGCGTNEIVKAYSGKGIGVDVYPWEGVDQVVKDTSELPFEKEKFDTVSIVAALNHIPNREEVLMEIKRILKDDGRLLITMIPPKFSRVWHFIRRKSDADQYERGMKSGEVYGLTIREIQNLLSKTGFEIIFKKKFMFGINEFVISKKRKDHH